MAIQRLRHSTVTDKDFIQTLRKRVNLYFKENGKTIYGNRQMYWKSVFMIALYFIPYLLLLLAGISNAWIVFGLWVLMGLGMSGIGLSIMHDANHGSYSKNKKVNKAWGFTLCILGGSPFNWKIQHNVLHHTYTNVEGYDEDIDPGASLRFSPKAPRYKAHKYQHLYAWFLYGLMTILWSTTKDFNQLKRYREMGLLDLKSKTYARYMFYIILTKVFYYGYALVLPIIFTPVAWYVTVLGYLAMHFIAGLILAAIFQSAHVMPTSTYPEPAEDGSLENNWAVHQLRTTTNFAPGARFFSWFIGGLNYQIEHHIFPNICHVHYKDISKIVEETATEFGLPYNSIKTFSGAIGEHFQMLKALGSADMVQVPVKA